LGVVACGTSGGGGEPAHGNAVAQYGTAMDAMTVGSAILGDPSTMVIQLGSDHVSCSTNLTGSLILPSGLYAYFGVPPTPGSNVASDVFVEHSTGNHLDIDGGGGTVTISSIDTRVMGTIAFMSTDSMSNAVSITGTFDVKKCF
jgi:hypothetical protein